MPLPDVVIKHLAGPLRALRHHVLTYLSYFHMPRGASWSRVLLADARGWARDGAHPGASVGLPEGDSRAPH